MTSTGTRVPDRRRAARLATLVAVPVAAVLALVLAFGGRDSGSGDDPTVRASATPTAAVRALPPITVAAPPALSAAAQKSCQELIAALPTELADRPARPVDSPSPYVVAWGDPAVTLRCGVARPPAFVGSAEVQQINGVDWFAERRGATTAWTVVDRPVYVEVVAPTDAASDPAARLSTAVTAALRKQALDPA